MKMRLTIHAFNNSIFDNDISNCNRLFWLRDEPYEAIS